MLQIPVSKKVQNDKKKYAFITEDGQELTDFNFDSLGEFHDGLAVAKKDGICGFINETFEWIFKSDFYSIDIFRHGLAQISAKDYSYVGLLTKDFKLVGEKAYDHISFGEANILGRKNETYYALNPDGSVKFESQFNLENHDNIEIVDGKWGALDGNNNWLVQPIYEKYLSFADEDNLRQAGYKENQWGILLGEKWLIEPKYIWINRLSDGLAAFLGENGLVGFVDKNNSVVIKPSLPDTRNFRDLYLFRNGLVQCKDGSGKVGFKNKKNEWAIQPIYSGAGIFSEGVCSVKNESGKWGYIDTSGTVIIDFKYISADEFVHGVARVGVDQNSWLFVDTTGKILSGFPSFGGKRYNFSEKTNWDISRALFETFDENGSCIFKNGNQIYPKK